MDFGEKEKAAFEAIKASLMSGLSLQTVDPDKPFILRVDASGRAVGAALEQFSEEVPGMPKVDDAMGRRKTVPVAFCSRKLTPGQVRSWTPREKETYAVVLALQKWASWIGLQPVLILTDHKSIEQWATEVLDTPSGPAGRRGRWHELLSKFDLEVAYIPGKDNVVADALSRWAYPASQAFADVSIHGSAEDDEDMHALIEEEEKAGRKCNVVQVEDLVEVMHIPMCHRIHTLRAYPAPVSPEVAEELVRWEEIRARVVTRGKSRALQETVEEVPRETLPEVPAEDPAGQTLDPSPEVPRGIPPRHSPRSTLGRRTSGPHHDPETPRGPVLQDGSSSSNADQSQLHRWVVDAEGPGEQGTGEEFLEEEEEEIHEIIPEWEACELPRPEGSPARDADQDDFFGRGPTSLTSSKRGPRRETSIQMKFSGRRPASFPCPRRGSMRTPRKIRLKPHTR